MQLTKILAKYPYSFLLALVVSVSLSTLRNDFLFIDDTYLIVNNPQLNWSLTNLITFFTKPLGQIYDATEYSIKFIYYRPVLNLLYMFNNVVWGMNPVGFHIVNLSIHFLTTVTIYRIGLHLFEEDKIPALIAAALFCVHPVHNEIIGRIALNENLLGFLMAASLYYYLKMRMRASLSLFALALLSKESAVMLPLVLVFFELRTKKFKAVIQFLSPYIVVTVSYLVVRTIVVGIPDSVGFNLQWDTSLLTNLSALGAYIRLLFVPYPLHIHYSVWKFDSLLQPELLVAYISLLLIGYVCIKWRKDELLLPLFSGIIILLVPVLLKANMLILGPERGFIAERQLYVPSMFFALLFGALLHKYSESRARICSASSVLIIVPLYVYVSILTTAVWENDDTVIARFFRDFPESAITHQHRGSQLLQQGDIDGAYSELMKALPPSIGNKSVSYKETGAANGKRFTRLANMFAYFGIAAYQQEYAEIHLNLGMVYLARHDFDAAMRKFRTVLVMHPHSVKARTELANIYMKKKMFKEASREFKIALNDIEAKR